MNTNYYLEKQKLLAARTLYRRFWMFWAIYSVFIIFVIGLYLLGQQEYIIIELALAAFILARFIFSPIIYFIYKKQRPYQQFNFKPISSWLMSRATIKLNSFPSDHAVSFAAIATVFFWYSSDLGILVLIAALLNGWARIILGYHDIKDILAGWAIGILSGLIVVYWLSPMLFTR